MFISSAKTIEIFEILKVLESELGKRVKLSKLDQQLHESILDLKKAMMPQPFKPYKVIAEAVGNYVELRDTLREDAASFNEHEQSLKGEMERISMWLRDRGDELGVDSFATPAGTAYRKVNTSYRTQDWNSFLEWMKETDNLQCVEKRPAKLAVKEIIDNDPNHVVPPGLEVFVEVEFAVNRPSAKKLGQVADRKAKVMDSTSVR